VIDLSTEPMERAWRNDLRTGLVLGGAILLVGVTGLAAIFWAQQRHLREVRDLEAMMAQRQRVSALGDVAAAFAHEVRNPLNAVSMGLQRLASEFTADSPDDYARFVELMQAEVRRLNTIVEQFISLARPLPLQPARMDPTGLLRELATLLEGDARASRVEVILDPGEDVPAIVADRDRLKQVLLNLALNGLQAMPDGGRLTLAARATRDRVTLVVEDTGAGIPPEALPRIFDPYFSTKSRGLGLGLTIARRIVEEHGGSIEASSEAGHGARFRVHLPRRGA
jgi:two-component system sensor histidine kinase HydH